MKNLIALLLLPCLFFTGCATTPPTTDLNTPTGTVSVPTSALTTAQTITNILNSVNSTLNASQPTINQVLVSTHNSGDQGAIQNAVLTTNLVTALVTAFNAAIQASKASGATPVQTQAAGAAVLAPGNVATITSNVVATTLATPAP